MNHLDLGCGNNPSNPYGCENVYGLDLDTHSLNPKFFKKFDFMNKKLPFPDNFFHSVSAIDVLEHVPRVVHYKSGKDFKSKFPFIDLMNEIYRVLAPNGKFFASTPSIDNLDISFSDPTHIHGLSSGTILYFTKPYLWANHYGFKGSFVKICHKKTYGPTRVAKKNIYAFLIKLLKKIYLNKLIQLIFKNIYITKTLQILSHFYLIKMFLKAYLHGKVISLRIASNFIKIFSFHTHILWELKAVK